MCEIVVRQKLGVRDVVDDFELVAVRQPLAIPRGSVMAAEVEAEHPRSRRLPSLHLKRWLHLLNDQISIALAMSVPDLARSPNKTPH